jgi:uncharacterized protein
MVINIKVVPRSKKNQIKEENGILKVYSTAPAVENKANEPVIGMLADFFRVRRNQIEIKRGHKSRNKVVEIK